MAAQSLPETGWYGLKPSAKYDMTSVRRLRHVTGNRLSSWNSTK